MALFAPPRAAGQPPVLACRGSCGSDAAGRSTRRVRLPSRVLPPDFRRGAQARPCSETAKSFCASLKPRRWLASGARTRWSFETASLEVIFAVRTPRLDIGAPFLDLIPLKSTRPVARPSEHRFLLLGGQFRPQGTIGPGTFHVRLVSTVNLCRAGPPQPPNSPLDPISAIDFTPLRFRFLLSLVARRRSARAYRRPRARPRRGEGVQDMQLDGTVASRRIWRSSRSPVPVPVAHCAPRMHCYDTPPTLVPRSHRG